MNELLFIISTLSCFLMLLAMYKLFGVNGIYGWICFATVFANIEVLLQVDCFLMTTTLGNSLFGSVFLATDILSENYGKEQAKKGVYIGLLIEVAFVILSQIDIAYQPSATDFAKDSFNVLFVTTPRVCLGSISAYIVGNLIDVVLYDKLKQAHGNKLMWLRNNLCTMLAQLIDNFVLHFIAFSNLYSVQQIIELSISVWVIEIVVGVLDTPFLYFAKRIENA